MTKKMVRQTLHKIAMIIAWRDFRDEEYFIPKSIFTRAGAEISTVSTQNGIAIGVEGNEAKVNILLNNLRVSDFDAIVFIGGQGALKELDNEKSYEIARNAVEDGKVLAAICISPVILAKAGVLKNKKATVWSGPLNRAGIKILKEEGAIYQDEQVVIDGKIITGNGPFAAKKFAEGLTEMLK
jgi:protease I